MLGRELADIDRLFGWTAGSRKVVPIAELAARMPLLLRAAARYARQLPPDHYGHVIPGQEDVTGPLVLPDGTELRLSDGTPYIPHHTYFDLVGHIAGHGAKFLHLARNPGSDVYSRMEFFAPLGEPDSDATLDEVCDLLETSARAIEEWSRDAAPGRAHPMLDSMTYSTAQHCRQLIAILELLGIEADGPLSEADYEGLALPAATWG